MLWEAKESCPPLLGRNERNEEMKIINELDFGQEFDRSVKSVYRWFRNEKDGRWCDGRHIYPSCTEEQIPVRNALREVYWNAKTAHGFTAR
jgi:hypothetical protein